MFVDTENVSKFSPPHRLLGCWKAFQGSSSSVWWELPGNFDFCEMFLYHWFEFNSRGTQQIWVVIGSVFQVQVSHSVQRMARNLSLWSGCSNASWKLYRTKVLITTSSVDFELVAEVVTLDFWTIGMVLWICSCEWLIIWSAICKIVHMDVRNVDNFSLETSRLMPWWAVYRI